MNLETETAEAVGHKKFGTQLVAMQKRLHHLHQPHIQVLDGTSYLAIGNACIVSVVSDKSIMHDV